MDTTIHTIIEHYCYTELVYGRINKKLKTNMSNHEIENFMKECMTSENIDIEKMGKNYYLKIFDHNIKITINSFTYRIITVDRF